MATTFGTAPFLDSTPALSTQTFGMQAFDWFTLEPTEGNYDLSPIEDALAECSALGKKMIVRIVPNWSSAATPGGGAQASPTWLLSQVATYTLGGKQNPDPSDTVYQTKFALLLDEIADQFDGDSRIEFIQAALGGVYGEMYMGTTNPSGWSISKQQSSILWHITAFDERFTNTPKCGMINTWSFPSGGPTDDDTEMVNHLVSLGWFLGQNEADGGNSTTRSWMNNNDHLTKICIEAENLNAAGHTDANFTAAMDNMFAVLDNVDYVVIAPEDFADTQRNAYVASNVLPNLRTNGNDNSGTGVNPNLLSNPDAEDDLNNIIGNGTGSSFTRAPDHAISGAWSVEVTTGTAADSGCAYTDPDGTVVAGQQYTGSCYIEHEIGSTQSFRLRLSWRLEGGAVNGSEVVGDTFNIPTETPTRIDVTAVAPENSSRCYVKVVRVGTNAVTFWADAAKLEVGPEPTAFQGSRNPTTATLITNRFAPNVFTPRTAVPTTGSVVINRFTPSVLLPGIFIPEDASLLTTRFAPSVNITEDPTPPTSGTGSVGGYASEGVMLSELVKAVTGLTISKNVLVGKQLRIIQEAIPSWDAPKPGTEAVSVYMSLYNHITGRKWHMAPGYTAENVILRAILDEV